MISSVLVVGTLGLHFLEGLSYVDAFYFMSMIATSEGPMGSLTTSAGKIFASVMAFVSVGFVIAAIGFLFGPFLGKLWRVGHDLFEEELELLKGEKDKKTK